MLKLKIDWEMWLTQRLWLWNDLEMWLRPVLSCVQATFLSNFSVLRKLSWTNIVIKEHGLDHEDDLEMWLRTENGLRNVAQRKLKT